jgi:hypothetical protein
VAEDYEQSEFYRSLHEDLRFLTALLSKESAAVVSTSLVRLQFSPDFGEND